MMAETSSSKNGFCPQRSTVTPTGTCAFAQLRPGPKEPPVRLPPSLCPAPPHSFSQVPAAGASHPSGAALLALQSRVSACHSSESMSPPGGARVCGVYMSARFTSLVGV